MPLNISSPPAPPASIKLLYDETLAAPAAGFTSANVSGYRRFIIEISGQITNAASIQIRLNGDAGANYNLQNLYGAGAGAGANTGVNQTSGALGGSNSAGCPFSLTAYIDNSNTTLRRSWVAIVGTSGSAYTSGGYWNNTALITAIYIFTADTLAAGSRILIYGES